VSDYEDEKPSEPKRKSLSARQKRDGLGEAKMTARERVGMMMAKAQAEELEATDSDEEAEC